MTIRVLPLIVLTLLLVGCSGDDTSGTSAPAPQAPSEQEADSPSQQEAPAASEKEAPPAEDASSQAAENPAVVPAVTALVPDAEGVIRVEATDMMRFNTERIEVEGTKIKLQLKHVGKMPKEAMGHNLVVLKIGTDTAGWSAKASSHKDNDYIPAEDPEMIAHTKLIGGGESDLIEFEVPGPGEYPFLCSFPGHSALMKGVLIVK